MTTICVFGMALKHAPQRVIDACVTDYSCDVERVLSMFQCHPKTHTRYVEDVAL